MSNCPSYLVPFQLPLPAPHHHHHVLQTQSLVSQRYLQDPLAPRPPQEALCVYALRGINAWDQQFLHAVRLIGIVGHARLALLMAAVILSHDCQCLHILFAHVHGLLTID